MNVDKPNDTIKSWNGVIEFEKPVPDARTEVVRAAIDAGLLKFEDHKEALLTILRDAHNHRPESEPFDEPKSWVRLINLAGTYFWQARVKQMTMDPGERVARLGKLARALGKARGMTDKAMQDDVGDDLFSAWWEGTNEPLASHNTKIARLSATIL